MKETKKIIALLTAVMVIVSSFAVMAADKAEEAVNAETAVTETVKATEEKAEETVKEAEATEEKTEEKAEEAEATEENAEETAEDTEATEENAEETKEDTAEITVGGVTYKKNYKTWYSVNGKYVDFNSNGIYTDTLVTEVSKGTVNLMPIRSFAEALNAVFKQEGNVWYVITDEYAIDFCAGDNFINVYDSKNGKNISDLVGLTWFDLDCAVVEHEGVTYIPFRSAICALFGVAEADVYTTDKIALTELEGGYAIFANSAGNAEADKCEKDDITNEIVFNEEKIVVSDEANKDNIKKYLGEEKQYYCIIGEDIRTFEEAELASVSQIVTEDDVITVNMGAYNNNKIEYSEKIMLRSEIFEEGKYIFGKEVADGALAGNIDYSYTKDDYTYVFAGDTELATITCGEIGYKFIGTKQTTGKGEAVVCSVKINRGTSTYSLKDGVKLNEDGSVWKPEEEIITDEVETPAGGDDTADETVTVKEDEDSTITDDKQTENPLGEATPQ